MVEKASHRSEKERKKRWKFILVWKIEKWPKNSSSHHGKFITHGVIFDILYEQRMDRNNTLSSYYIFFDTIYEQIAYRLHPMCVCMSNFNFFLEYFAFFTHYYITCSIQYVRYACFQTCFPVPHKRERHHTAKKNKQTLDICGMNEWKNEKLIFKNFLIRKKFENVWQLGAWRQVIWNYVSCIKNDIFCCSKFEKNYYNTNILRHILSLFFVWFVFFFAFLCQQHFAKKKEVKKFNL